jgi:hypothetical protein
MSTNPFSTTPQGLTPPNTPIISTKKARTIYPIQTSKFALLPAEILTKILKPDTHSASIKASFMCRKLFNVRREMYWCHHTYGGTGWMCGEGYLGGEGAVGMYYSFLDLEEDDGARSRCGGENHCCGNKLLSCYEHILTFADSRQLLTSRHSPSSRHIHPSR